MFWKEKKKKKNSNVICDVIISSAVKWKILEHQFSFFFFIKAGKRRRRKNREAERERERKKKEEIENKQWGKHALSDPRRRKFCWCCLDWVTLMTCHDDNCWFMLKQASTTALTSVHNNHSSTFTFLQDDFMLIMMNQQLFLDQSLSRNKLNKKNTLIHSFIPFSDDVFLLIVDNKKTTEKEPWQYAYWNDLKVDDGARVRINKNCVIRTVSSHGKQVRD